MAETSLKEKMIEEAYRIINTNGFENFSVRIISNKLGVSHNALYKHFVSKDELLLEVVKVGFATLTSEFRKIQGRTDLDQITQVKEFLIAYIEFSLKNAEIYKLMYNSDLLIKNFTDLFLDISIMDGGLDKVSDQDSLDAGKINEGFKHAMANTVWAFTHGLSLLLMYKILPLAQDLDSPPKLMNDNDEEISIRNSVERSIDIFMNGLIFHRKTIFPKTLRHDKLF